MSVSPYAIDDHPMAGWPEIDTSLLEEGRGAVPAFPLELLPQPWRDWISDTARSAGAPADYVAQAVLGAVAGLCGAGVVVRVTPAWAEPLVLWQAVVGGPSSGKSPALAPVRSLLAALEDELPAPGEAGPRIVVTDTAIEAIADAVSGNPRGVILWRDELSAWTALPAAGSDSTDRAHWLEGWAAGGVTIKRRTPLQLKAFAVSVLGTIQPERLAEALEGDGDDLAARLLYAWPERPPYCPLAERGLARDDQALAMLRRIARKARTPDDALVLAFDAHGVKAFDDFLAGLHAELRGTEGLWAGWLGKGSGTVARLAGALELLAWSGLAAPGLPGAIGRTQVEAAAGLWTGYFRPHARAVLDRTVPTDLEQRARRVARWLKEDRRTEVSREDIRREALAQSVNSKEADMVLYRLTGAGILRFVTGESSPRGGPRVRRWQVHPALRAP